MTLVNLTLYSAFFAYFSSAFYVVFIMVVIGRSIQTGILTFDWLNEIDLFVPRKSFHMAITTIYNYTIILLTLHKISNDKASLMSGALRYPWPFCHSKFRPNNGYHVKEHKKLRQIPKSNSTLSWQKSYGGQR